jgi:serine protease inhibitor
MNTKKAVALILTAIVLLMIPLGCGPAEPANKDTHALSLASPGTIEEDVGYFDLSEAFRDSLWAFAGKTSGVALQAFDGTNTLYSPVSLYYGLAMLEAGAAGTTKTDLRAFLETDADARMGEQLRKLYALMTLDGDDTVERIANALWIREDLVSDQGGVKQSWLDQLSEDFYASAFAVDFTRPQTPEAMSRWVEEETKGKIKPEIDVSDPGLLLILMNTLYFKAGWLEPFDKDEIFEDDFYSREGTIPAIPYLTRTYYSISARQTDRYSAVSLPLTGGKIDFILPTDGTSPDLLLEDASFLTSLHSGEWEAFGVDLKLPLFEYKAKTDILEAMKPLGLPAMVKDSPDFSSMIERGAEVSTITQEAFIALDEKGVEAAAYTEIGMVESAPAEPSDHLVIYLDRPFLFVITDQAGAPLFVGIIRNPAHS